MKFHSLLHRIKCSCFVSLLVCKCNLHKIFDLQIENETQTEMKFVKCNNTDSESNSLSKLWHGRCWQCTVPWPLTYTPCSPFSSTDQCVLCVYWHVQRHKSQPRHIDVAAAAAHMCNRPITVQPAVWSNMAERVYIYGVFPRTAEARGQEGRCHVV